MLRAYIIGVQWQRPSVPCVVHIATCLSEKTTSVTENPRKATLTTLIQNLVIFTRLGACVDSEVRQGTKMYKYTFFENARRRMVAIELVNSL